MIFSLNILIILLINIEFTTQELVALYTYMHVPLNGEMLPMKPRSLNIMIFKI